MKTPKSLLENTREFRRTPKGVLTNLYHKMKERNKKNNRGELEFSLKDFHDKYLNNENFLKIYQNWVDSMYIAYEKPSIDRENPDEGYVIDNLQMMTWKENRRKGDIENSNRITTAIVMCDFDGTVIKEFESVKQAVVETGLSQGNIVMCCQGKRNHTGGYVFKYRGDRFRKS